MSFKSTSHACPQCGVKHPSHSTQTCDATGCTVEGKELPYYIVARPPWAEESGLLHACSPAHACAVIGEMGADSTIEIEAKQPAMVALFRSTT